MPFPRGEPPEAPGGATWPVTGPEDLAPVRAAIVRAVTAPARSIVRHRHSSGVPLLAETSERAAVVFSELATNALRYGGQPISASLQRSVRGWLILIEDARGEQEPHFREPSPDRAGGHGLRLVTRLAENVGWASEGSRKCVWAEVGDDPPAGLVTALTRRGGLRLEPD